MQNMQKFALPTSDVELELRVQVTVTVTPADSLNIMSLPACPLGRVPPAGPWAAPEGTAGGLYTPGEFEEKKEDSM